MVSNSRYTIIRIEHLRKICSRLFCSRYSSRLVDVWCSSLLRSARLATSRLQVRNCTHVSEMTRLSNPRFELVLRLPGIDLPGMNVVEVRAWFSDGGVMSCSLLVWPVWKTLRGGAIFALVASLDRLSTWAGVLIGVTGKVLLIRASSSSTPCNIASSRCCLFSRICICSSNLRLCSSRVCSCSARFCSKSLSLEFWQGQTYLLDIVPMTYLNGWKIRIASRCFDFV